MNNQIVANAFIFEAAKKLAVIAKALGDDADAAAYETFAGQVREAVNDAFYDLVNKAEGRNDCTGLRRNLVREPPHPGQDMCLFG